MQSLVRGQLTSPEAADMAVGEDLVVGAEQGNPQLAGLGHQEAIGGIEGQHSTSRLRASRPRFTSIATSQQLIADTSRPAEPPGRPALSIS